ncbi:transcription initiation factor IIE subunit alpha [Sarcoptes scabiei]|nr:transcription initiation factor IIE subunit alpha [Sarcoptes scabiei]
MMKDIVEESSIFIQKIQQQSRSISIRTCTINVENLQVITRKTELQDRIIANYIMKLIKLNRASEKFIRVSSVRLVLVSFRNFLMLLVCVRFSNKLFMKMKLFCFFL